MQKGNGVDEANRKFNSLRTQYDSVVGSNQQLKTEIAQLEGDLAREKSIKETSQQEHGATKLKCRQFETKSAQLTKQLELINLSLEEHKQEKVQFLRTINTMSEKIGTLNNQQSLAQASSATEKDVQRKEYLNIIETQKQEIRSMSTRLTAAEKTTKAENDQLKLTNQELESKLIAYESEMSAQIDAYKDKLCGMINQLHGKDSELEKK